MFGISLMLLLPYLAVTDSAYCNGSSYGTEFIFGLLDLPFYVQNNQTALNPHMSVMVTPEKYSTYYYVTLQSTNSASKTPTIVRTQYYAYRQGEELKFNSTFINRYQDISTGGVINITSDEPVSLMVIYKFTDGDKTDMITYPVLPTSVLSTDYVIPSYPASSDYHGKNQFMVVGLHDSTSIRFEGYETGSMVYDVDDNDIFMYERRVDISSTSAVSNHPVAIFSWITAGDYSGTPNKGYVGRSLAMQVPPLDESAVHFVIPPLTGDSIHRYNVRIYASARNAQVEIHSTSQSTQYVHVYNKIYYEYTAIFSSDILEILSDNPIVVVQIALNTYSMPLFMTSVPAVSQFMTSYKVNFPYISSYSSQRSVVVTIPYKEASGVLINGDPIIHDTSSLKKSPLGHYAIIIHKTSRSTLTVDHAGVEQFGVIALRQWQAYRGTDEAHGFVPGIQFAELNCGSVQTSQIVG